MGLRVRGMLSKDSWVSVTDTGWYRVGISALRVKVGQGLVLSAREKTTGTFCGALPSSFSPRVRTASIGAFSAVLALTRKVRSMRSWARVMGARAGASEVRVRDSVW